MQKQCFEFLTSQGPKAKSAFSVLCTNSGTPTEVPREYDNSINGNCFRLLDGQRVHLPPKPNHNLYGAADAQGQAANRGTSKSVSPGGMTPSLNGPYAFLVLQVFLPSGEPFQIEITLRDKQNHKRRIILSDQVQEFPSLWGHTTHSSSQQNNQQSQALQQSQAVARVPTGGCLQRDQWMNLCIDVNSFVAECFRPRPYPNPANNNSSAEKPKSYSVHATPSGQQDTGNNTQLPHGVRQIESLTIEGPNVKLRKILNCKFQLPQEQSDQLGLEEVFDNGVRVENLPKQMNFIAGTQKVNQIVTADLVKALAAADHQRNIELTVEDSLILTRNLKMMPFETTITNGPSHTQTQLNGHLSSQVSPMPIRELTNLEKSTSNLNDEHNAPQFYHGMDNSQIQYQQINKNPGMNTQHSFQNSQVNDEVDVNKIEEKHQSELRILPQITSGNIGTDLKVMNMSSNATPLPNNQQQLLRVGPHHMNQQNQALMNNNNHPGGVTSESIFKLASSTKTSAIVKHTNQSLSTAYSVRTTSSSKQQQPQSNLGVNCPQIGVVGQSATSGAATNKPGLQSSLSPFSSSLMQQQKNQLRDQKNIQADPAQAYHVNSTTKGGNLQNKQQINFTMRKHSVNSRSNGQFEPVEEFVPNANQKKRQIGKNTKNATKPPPAQKQIKQEIETAMTTAVNNPWGSPGSSPINFNSSTGKRNTGTKKHDGLSNKPNAPTNQGVHNSKATIYLKNGTSQSMGEGGGSASKNSNWNSQANLHASEILTNNTATPKPQKLQDVHEIIPIVEENETIRASVDKHGTSKMSQNASQSTPASLLANKQSDKPPQARFKKQGNHTDLKKLQEEVQESKAKVKRINAGYNGAAKRRPAPTGNQLHQPQASAPPAPGVQQIDNVGQHTQTPGQQPKSSGATGHPRFSENQKTGKLIKRTNAAQNNTNQAQMGNSFVNMDESMIQGVRGNSCANINEKRIGNGLTNTGRHSNGPQKLNPKGSAAKQHSRRVGMGSTSDNGMIQNPNQPYQSQYGARSYEDEQSDFKTTTLRFTNNNFIIDAPAHLLQNTTIVNDKQLQATNGGQGNHPFSPKRKGQSDLRNMSQSSSFMHNHNGLPGQQHANISGGYNALQGNVTTTAGLNLRNMHDQMLSLQEEQQDDEEDMIEEEINEQNESPLPMRDQKTKKGQNFKHMQPAALPANFLDQSERVVDSHQIYGMPINKQQLQQINQDKGHKMQQYYQNQGYQSPSGAQSPQREAIIEEDFSGVANALHDDTTRGAIEMKTMTETFTSEFYQAPVQGGIPVRLRVESRRPFTPPFTQLFTKVDPMPMQTQQQQLFTEMKLNENDGGYKSPGFPRQYSKDDNDIIEEQIVGQLEPYQTYPKYRLDEPEGGPQNQKYDDQGETTDVTKETPVCSERPQLSAASGIVKTDAIVAIEDKLPNFTRNGLGLKLSKGNASAEGLLDEEYLMDQQSNSKAKFMYDKSLRAYYDPKTQEYFEMR